MHDIRMNAAPVQPPARRSAFVARDIAGILGLAAAEPVRRVTPRA